MLQKQQCRVFGLRERGWSPRDVLGLGRMSGMSWSSLSSLSSSQHSSVLALRNHDQRTQVSLVLQAADVGSTPAPHATTSHPLAGVLRAEKTRGTPRSAPLRSFRVACRGRVAVSPSSCGHHVIPSLATRERATRFRLSGFVEKVPRFGRRPLRTSGHRERGRPTRSEPEPQTLRAT